MKNHTRDRRSSRDFRLLSFQKAPTGDASRGPVRRDDGIIDLTDREVELIHQYRSLSAGTAYDARFELLTYMEREIVEYFRDLTDTQQLAHHTAMYCEAFRNIQARIARSRDGAQQAAPTENQVRDALHAKMRQ